MIKFINLRFSHFISFPFLFSVYYILFKDFSFIKRKSKLKILNEEEIKFLENHKKNIF